MDQRHPTANGSASWREFYLGDVLGAQARAVGGWRIATTGIAKADAHLPLPDGPLHWHPGGARHRDLGVRPSG